MCVCMCICVCTNVLCNLVRFVTARGSLLCERMPVLHFLPFVLETLKPVFEPLSACVDAQLHSTCSGRGRDGEGTWGSDERRWRLIKRDRNQGKSKKDANVLLEWQIDSALQGRRLNTSCLRCIIQQFDWTRGVLWALIWSIAALGLSLCITSPHRCSDSLFTPNPTGFWNLLGVCVRLCLRTGGVVGVSCNWHNGTHCVMLTCVVFPLVSGHDWQMKLDASGGEDELLSTSDWSLS